MEQEIRYSKMDNDHVSGVVDLYLSSFNGFIADMGKRFLTLYYREFCSHNSHFSVVASELDKNDSRVVGYIIGTTKLSQHNKQLYRNHFFTIGSIFIYKLLTNKSIRNFVLHGNTAKKLLRVFLTMIRRPSTTASIKPTRRPNTVLLMLIIVHRGLRGTTVASNLLDSFENQIKEAGISEGILRANLENVRAIRFYEKYGWTPTKIGARNKNDKYHVYYTKTYS